VGQAADVVTGAMRVFARDPRVVSIDADLFGASVRSFGAPPQGPNCWGKLVGTGGRFKGPTGAFTLQSGQNGSTGAGLWSD